MKELRDATDKQPLRCMLTSPDEAQLLGMLLKLIGAKNTLEVGVYTGYSLLATALALPDDGKVLAMDIKREYYEIGLPMIKKAGVAHKVDFREGPALPMLDRLLEDVRRHAKHGSFDFAFVDADKDNYLNYHERLVRLVRPGGVIGYDNTLWCGTVAADTDAVAAGGAGARVLAYYRHFVLELNASLAADPRVEICHLTIGDGLTLCRRIK
ncbi:caffeoyl-CoA O-methyltransferase-like isoform X2 [Ananas comosus]|uniref:Caffeoyl-CoA O-methyltransferase-like isoform X2 n=1 Tax=Ananas comosus TaxID=4615 RepID=A0A6P5F580_ANACO|nr:caffeoyl-CoA O-methyltransferase-like isoform X2 [Ananas comosus]